MSSNRSRGWDKPFQALWGLTVNTQDLEDPLKSLPGSMVPQPVSHPSKWSHSSEVGICGLTMLVPASGLGTCSLPGTYMLCLGSAIMTALQRELPSHCHLHCVPVAQNALSPLSIGILFIYWRVNSRRAEAGSPEQRLQCIPYK